MSEGKVDNDVRVVVPVYLTDESDGEFDYEQVPEDSDEDEDNLFEQEETLAFIQRNVQRSKHLKNQPGESKQSNELDDTSEESRTQPSSNEKQTTMNKESKTVVRPAVLDDFFRTFLIKLKMTRTLDVFNTEWYEFESKGKLNAEQVGAVPDIYIQNQELDEMVKSLRVEIARMQQIADDAESTWDKFRKERDFHRMHHKRVVQEKNKMVEEIKRLKKHYQTYEPTIKQLRAKYEVAMKEKMLMKIERDKAAVRLEAAEAHAKSRKELEDATVADVGVKAIADTPGSGKTLSTMSSFLPNALATSVDTKKTSAGGRKKTLPGKRLPQIDPPNPYLTQKFERVNVQALQMIKTFEGHMNAISALAFHPKKQVVATASDDHTWKLWSVPNGDLIMSGEGHQDWVSGIDFSPQGVHLISSSGDGTVKLWDFAKASCAGTLVDHAQPVWDVAWHYSGDFFASCSMDHSAKLWDATSLRCKTTFRGHVDSVNAVTFQPSSSNVCTASGDKTVSMWDSRSGLCIQTFFGHTNACNGLTINLQGDTIASCDADGVIKLWDIRMVQERATLNTGSHALNDISFDRSGEVLVAGSDDGTIKTFNVQDMKPTTILKGHEDAVQSVVFDPNGRYFVSAASDKTFRLWK